MNSITFNIDAVNINAISEIQQCLDLYDITSLVFLLYDIPHMALEHLALLQRIPKEDRKDINTLCDWEIIVMETQTVYFVGVDVGSGSVRAALVNEQGHVLKSAVKEIQTWNPKADYYEQSSDNIWNCCVDVIKIVVADVNVHRIKGIGFDATCSLVVLDVNGCPASVSESNNEKQNIIMWMDHRAQSEADFINGTGHDILKYVGGKVSLEMEMPKILWLKKNFPERWAKFDNFFDLPDFLTWKATGCKTRSLCSLVCKWNYECSAERKRGWNVDFLNKIGLGDLCENNFRKIGHKVLVPGEPCGNGLAPKIAEELGLLPQTPVATSIIDAHAGGLGMIGTSAPMIDKDITGRLSLICGTSTCHMAINNNAVQVRGVWGPYFSAMVPNMWLNEAGQSASGMLLDYVICSHPASQKLFETMNTGEVRNHLRELLSQIANGQGLSNVNLLTKDFHMWPDFHGNRSPLADPTMKGMIVGLTINNSIENLAILYLACLQALANNFAKGTVVLEIAVPKKNRSECERVISRDTSLDDVRVHQPDARL
ncbi:FGGY carbohydrate kinase domain-containing protein [Eumeta japonica]|uniref:FGGY carbohydrate kinase domain-containing protein n=1 Tax=Eumeta variegata TaxID=151549 RepID=A0A4C1TM80_EUMVA|nr:FGGY carbohydrate kinase domain-containing protein [Eumeta japonica]